MTQTIDDFIAHLDPRVRGILQGTAKLVITDEGSVWLSTDGAIASDADADVTLTASEKTFRKILDGSQNSAMAFMSGKLKVDGSNMRALKVAEILTAAV